MADIVRKQRPTIAELKRQASQPTHANWGGQAIDSTLDRGRANSSGIAIGVTGRLTLIGAVMIPAGRTVTNITVVSGSTAVVNPTNQWFTLVDSAAGNAILAKTIDNTTTAWGTVTARTLALSATYTPTTDKLALIGVGITAGTMPTLSGWTGLSIDVGGFSPVISGLAVTGLTDPASFTAVGAITGAATIGYAWIA